MKTVKILLTLVAFLLMATPAEAAGVITSLRLTLSNPTQQATGVQHKINGVLQDAASEIGIIKMTYCTRASTSTGNVAGGCDTPEGLAAASPTVGDTADWTNLGTGNTDWTATYNAGTMTLTKGTPAAPTTTTVSWEAGGITNPKIDADTGDNECLIPRLPNGDPGIAASSSSATCFIRLSTRTVGDVAIDEGVTSFTVVRAVTVSATVDPTFTFRVVGVNASQAAAGLTTTVSSAYNTLPFGNLQAGTVKYAAHELFVTTNTENGYGVNAKLTQTVTGVYGGDIDAFTTGGSSWAAGGTAWTSPTGSTPNTNTGWFGAHIEDSVTGGGPSGAGNFGPISETAVLVKDSDNADNGSDGHFVVYAMEVNVYQPADTYTGTLVYNALPTY